MSFAAVKERLRFYFLFARFGFLEQFSNLANGLAGFLLFPLFMLVLASTWQKFSGHLGNYTFAEVAAYIGVTEVLFMTFLRAVYINRANGDFSLTLARPRSWLLMNGAALFGRCFGNRLVFVALLFPFALLFGISMEHALLLTLRLLLFVPILGIIQALYNLLFASAQILWAQVQNLTLPVGKMFLIFGGVFTPLSDFSPSAQKILLELPTSDIFFQVGYFCLRGEFYHLTSTMWLLRITVQIFALLALNLWFYQRAKKYHQGYGG